MYNVTAAERRALDDQLRTHYFGIEILTGHANARRWADQLDRWLRAKGQGASTMFGHYVEPFRRDYETAPDDLKSLIRPPGSRAGNCEPRGPQIDPSYIPSGTGSAHAFPRDIAWTAVSSTATETGGATASSSATPPATRAAAARRDQPPHQTDSQSEGGTPRQQPQQLPTHFTITPNAPASGTLPDSQRFLSETDRRTWREWAKWENTTRAAILSTVHGALAIALNDCWDSSEMYNRIRKEYFRPTAELYQTVLSRFSNLRLDYPCSSVGMHAYLNEFLSILKDAEQCDFTISEEEKVGRFLAGLNPNHFENITNMIMLLQNTSDTAISFDAYVNVFTKMTSRQATGEAMDSNPVYYSFSSEPAPRQTSYAGARFGRDAIYQSRPSSYNTAPRHASHDHSHPHHSHAQGNLPLQQTDNNKQCTWCERVGHTYAECRQRLQGHPSKRMMIRGGQLELQKWQERQKQAAGNAHNQYQARPQQKAVPAQPQQVIPQQATAPAATQSAPIHVTEEVQQVPFDYGVPLVDDLMDPDLEQQAATAQDGIGEVINYVDDAYDNYDAPYSSQDFEQGAVMSVTRDGAAPSPAVTSADWQTTAQQSIVNNLSIIPTEFVLDSGASSHIVRDPRLLSNIRPVRPITFTSAALDQSFMCGRAGTLTIRFNPVTVALVHNVYLCSKLSRNLLSAKRLIDNKWVVLLNNDEVVFRGVKVAINWPNQIAVIRLHAQRSDPHLILAAEHFGNPLVDSPIRKSPLHALHERLAHTSRTALLRLAKDGRIPLSHKAAQEDPFKITDCYSCVAGTLSRIPSLGTGPRAPSAQSETLQCDFAGPFTPSESGHYSQMLFMKTDFTNIGFSFPCLNKGQDVMLKHLGFVLRHLQLRGVNVVLVCADNAFDLPLVRQLCTSRGVAMRFSPPYEHNVTGQIERFIGIAKTRARAVMLATPFPSRFWDFAINYVVDVINMTADSGVPGKTPWEIWTGRPPNLPKIRQFGEFVSVHISLDTGHRAKNALAQPVNQLARHLGFARESSAYKVRLEVNGHILTTAQVRSGPPYPLSTPLRPLAPSPSTHPRGTPVVRKPGEDPIALEPVAPIIPSLLRKHMEQQQQTSTASGGSTESTTPGGPIALDGALTPGGAAPVSLPHKPDQAQAMHFQPRPVTHDDHNCGDHPLDFVPEVKPSDTNPDNHFALASIGLYIASQLPTPGAPRNYKQAMRTPEAPLWQEAYDKEISQLRERGTWRECVTPPGARLIPSVTVCKEKKDKDGNVIGRKMRICAMGSRQVQGRDYTDSYASVCDASVLRGMMAFAAHHDMELEHADAVAAFLNPDLDQPVYMRFPAGYKPLDPNADCLQVVKGLYGLPQSGNLWQDMATKALVSLQFSPIPQSDCLFQRDVGTPTQLRVALYVDDMLGAGKTHALLDQFWDKLNEKFAIVKLGPVDHLLGMTIQRNRLTRTLFITQAPYVKEVLARFPHFDKTVGKAHAHAALGRPAQAQRSHHRSYSPDRIQGDRR